MSCQLVPSGDRQAPRLFSMDPASKGEILPREDGGAPRSRAELHPEEPDPRGFHELAFLGQSNASDAEPELEERDVGPEFDSYEDLDGDKLRLLDRCVGCV